MGKRIILFDEHRPDEPLEAEVEQSSPMELTLAIPSTQVRFKLHRQHIDLPFEGSLNGRNFQFDPGKSPFAALFERAVLAGRDERNIVADGAARPHSNLLHSP